MIFRQHNLLSDMIGRPASLTTYLVQRAARRPLVNFMVEALRDAGCTLLHEPDASEAPFLISFETPDGARIGIVAYAFYIGPRTPTKNRPEDERSFQIKYGGKASNAYHELFQDPLGLLTTIFIGLSPEESFFVAPDPAAHNPTRLFIRLEFKDEHVEEIQSAGWHSWERDRRPGKGNEEDAATTEVLVGGRKERFLDLIRFERLAQDLPPGDRQLLAEQMRASFVPSRAAAHAIIEADVSDITSHPLITELELKPEQVLDLIQGARRLKMAVRGWVAEEHLRRTFEALPGVTDLEALDGEGQPDLRLRWRGSPPLTIECKNVLRKTNAAGVPRLDFQRTRAAKGDPCSRYYAPADFDLVAGCLHAVTEAWEFRYIVPARLSGHAKCPGKLVSNVLIDERWSVDAAIMLDEAVRLKGEA
jgi:hypothetical protein